MRINFQRLYFSFQLVLDIFPFSSFSTSDITETYEVGNSCYAYEFFSSSDIAMFVLFALRILALPLGTIGQYFT